MRCPFCGAEDTKVVDSRLANDGDNVRRRRECLTCEERFTTFETAELIMPRIIKGDDRREPFDEEKMRGGMLRALEKRPVAVERIETAINRILHSLHTRGDREVPSKDVGRLVMEQLRDLDDVAYVRFASVYRDFQDASEFREELDRLEKEISPAEKEKQLSFLDQEQASNDKKRRK